VVKLYEIELEMTILEESWSSTYSRKDSRN